MKKFFISLGLFVVAVTIPIYLNDILDGRGRAASEEVYLTPPFTPPSSPTNTPPVFTPPTTGANVRVGLTGLDPQINSYVKRTLTYTFAASEPISGQIMIGWTGLGSFGNGQLINVLPSFANYWECTNTGTYLYTCPFTNIGSGRVNADIRFSTSPGLDLTGTWITSVKVVARTGGGVAVNDNKTYMTQVVYNPPGPTSIPTVMPTVNPSPRPTEVPLRGFVPSVLGGVSTNVVCNKSDANCKLQFTASFKNPNNKWIYKPVFWKSGYGRFMDGNGVWRSDSGIYPASQLEAIDPMYGTVSSLVNMDNPGVVGTYAGTIYAAGKFCYNMADPTTCTMIVPTARVDYKLTVVADPTPTPVAVYCGLGGIYGYVSCDVKSGGYKSATYDCYRGTTKLYTGTLNFNKCATLTEIKTQASMMCAKRCNILKEPPVLRKGL